MSGPAATTATRNKVLGGPLSALGLAFARLPEDAQARHSASLLALAGPLLAHLSDKALRKKLLQVGGWVGATLAVCVAPLCCWGLLRCTGRSRCDLVICPRCLCNA